MKLEERIYIGVFYIYYLKPEQLVVFLIIRYVKISWKDNHGNRSVYAK
jgi:hypothetical protein